MALRKVVCPTCTLCPSCVSLGILSCITKDWSEAEYISKHMRLLEKPLTCRKALAPPKSFKSRIFIAVTGTDLAAVGSSTATVYKFPSVQRIQTFPGIYKVSLEYASLKRTGAPFTCGGSTRSTVASFWSSFLCGRAVRGARGVR